MQEEVSQHEDEDSPRTNRGADPAAREESTHQTGERAASTDQRWFKHLVYKGLAVHEQGMGSPPRWRH